MLGIRTGKHPHEVALLSATMFLGFAGLFFYPVLATPTARALPPPFGHILYAGLGVGSLIALVGVFWGSLTGALVERVGLFSLSLHAIAYTAAIAANSGIKGLNFAAFMTAFATANLIRSYQIAREIDQMEAARILLLAPRPEEDEQ